jgi:hypothetical protein
VLRTYLPRDLQRSINVHSASPIPCNNRSKQKHRFCWAIFYVEGKNVKSDSAETSSASKELGGKNVKSNSAGKGLGVGGVLNASKGQREQSDNFNRKTPRLSYQLPSTSTPHLLSFAEAV